MNFFEHEGREAAFLRRRRAPGDVLHFAIDPLAGLHMLDGVGVAADDRVFVVVQNDDVAGVFDERVDIRGEKRAVLADPKHKRTFFAGAENLARRVRRDKRERIRPFQPLKRLEHGAFHVFFALKFVLQHMRNHFRIGLRHERMPGGAEFLL